MNQRYKTIRGYNLDICNKDKDLLTYEWEMPVLEPCFTVPSRLLGFNYAITSRRKDAGIHFYLDDYQFERIWNKPARYIPPLHQYECVLTPDFSLYADMPRPLQIYNIYRSRVIGTMLQENGLSVIPTVSWSDEKSYDFCFDGIPEMSTVSISTVGVKRYKDALSMWHKGVDAMLERLQPQRILVYGSAIEHDYKGAEVVYYKNEVTERFDKLRSEE